MSQSSLLRDRRFHPLMWTQFFGALNDNFLKNALVVMIAFKGIQLWGLPSESLVSLATLIFILPFFLFSALAGQVADKFERSQLIRWIKMAEIGIMLTAGVGFYLSYFPLLFATLFLMGLHSAFFGPLKYSVLPDLVSTEELTTANAYVEVGTFIAILIGTIAGGQLISVQHGELYLTGLLVFTGIVGYLFSKKIPVLRIADPNIQIQLNPITPTWETLRASFDNKAVFNSILGISWFWFLGAVILSLLPTITKQLLNANEQVITLFLAIFTIGIAIGAVACEKLSYKRVEIGLVPLGSLGMTFFLTDMAFVLAGWVPSVGTADLHSYFNTAGSLRLGIDLLGIAFFGGIFTVPLYTLIQQRSRPEVRSRVIGANNIMNALFMVIGSALLVWFLQMKMSIPTILLAYAGFNLIVAVYIYTLVPEFTMRFLAWILAHCFYRLRVTNEERIPKEGTALLVCNHVSFIDWMIIAAGVRRPLRFVMYYKFAQLPLLRYLLKQAGAIPIAGKNEDPVIFEQAFVRIHKCLQEGELVCIFPEGALTKDGELQEFRKGVEHIIAKVPVPVVPMALNSLWGSIFSHKGSKALTKLPRKIWFPVHLDIDHALPATEVTAAHLEMRVRQMLT